jgi:hypothetical protein
MQYRTPRAIWFNERAEDCRIQAKLSSPKEAGYFRMAAAYDKLAEATEQNELISARIRKSPNAAQG